MVAEHTPREAAEAAPKPVAERKWKPDGTCREYACTLRHSDGSLVVIEFAMPQGGNVFGAPITIPPGSVSHGYFWLRRPYNLYRMRGPDGQVIAHRFDAVADVTFDGEHVNYRDLILDWWVTSDDELIEEDREEFEAAVAEGGMAGRDLAEAQAGEKAVYSRYRHIIDEAAAIERRLGLDASLH
jgi:hypothetical protein